jgi:acetate kinase
MHILIVNAGSSSLKFRVLDDDDALLATRDLPKLGPRELVPAIAAFIDDAPAIDAAGHRVVHGGSKFTEPAAIGTKRPAKVASQTRGGAASAANRAE